MKLSFFFLVCFLLSAPALRAQTENLNRFVDDHKSDPGLSFAYLSQDLYEVVNKQLQIIKG